MWIVRIHALVLYYFIIVLFYLYQLTITQDLQDTTYVLVYITFILFTMAGVGALVTPQRSLPQQSLGKKYFILANPTAGVRKLLSITFINFTFFT